MKQIDDIDNIYSYHGVRKDQVLYDNQMTYIVNGTNAMLIDVQFDNYNDAKFLRKVFAQDISVKVWTYFVRFIAPLLVLLTFLFSAGIIKF